MRCTQSPFMTKTKAPTVKWMLIFHMLCRGSPPANARSQPLAQPEAGYHVRSEPLMNVDHKQRRNERYK